MTADDIHQSLQESQIEFLWQKVGEDVGGLCLGPSWIDDDDKHDDDDEKKNVENVFKAIHLFLHGLSHHPCRLQGNLEGGLHAFIDDYEEEEEDNSENTWEYKWSLF